MDELVLSLIVWTPGANMAGLRFLAKCMQVCKQWLDMARAVRANTSKTSFTSMYNLSAEAFRKDLRVQMLDRYATAYAAEIARNAAGGVRGTQEAEDAIHMQLVAGFDNAALYLAKGLEAHLMHAETVALCLELMSRLVDVFSQEEDMHPLNVTRSCQWPVLRVLQAHPNDLTLAFGALRILHSFSELKSPMYWDVESIPTHAARVTAEHITTAYMESFSAGTTVTTSGYVGSLPIPTRENMLSTCADVLNWIFDGTLIRPDGDS